jgi:hypothetical protein
VYGVSIFQDGAVVFEGRAHVAAIGVQRGSISSGELSALISQIDAVRFLDSSSDCCVCSESKQAEMVVLDYRPGSIAKTIVHDAQCPSAPPGIRELEQAIDQVAGVERWTTGHSTADVSAR